jgi:hypothetical protein
VPDPQEREVVERIYQMEASGMSQEDICNALTNERIVRRHGRWFPVVIRRVLAAREQGYANLRRGVPQPEQAVPPVTEGVSQRPVQRRGRGRCGAGA